VALAARPADSEHFPTRKSAYERNQEPDDASGKPDGIFRYLAGLGYTLAPLADWGAAFFRFPQAEVERLAESEHDRFVAERMRQSWRYTSGPKDIQARLSPALRPWAELPKDEQRKNCVIMRELPASLARAGFQIIRLPCASAPAGCHPENSSWTTAR